MAKDEKKTTPQVDLPALASALRMIADGIRLAADALEGGGPRGWPSAKRPPVKRGPRAIVAPPGESTQEAARMAERALRAKGYRSTR